MRATRLTYKRSYKTLWFGLAGTVVVIVGSILFGYAQAQKQEAEKMNPTKPVPSDAELQQKFTSISSRASRSLVRWINSIAAQAGQVSRSRLGLTTSRKNAIRRTEWSASRFAGNR